jgi:hypothetical protein
MAFTLTIEEGKGRGRRFELSAPSVTLGRDPDNDVVLEDPGVSRHHARLEQRAGKWLLADSGSANGTEVNGCAIASRQPLKAGDRIRMGAMVVRFADSESRDSKAVNAWAAAGLNRFYSSPRFALAILVALGAAILIAVLALLIAHSRAPHRDPAAAAESRSATIAQAQDTGASKVGAPEELTFGKGDVRAARAAYERGRRKWEERRIAPRNLQDACKAFIEASGHLGALEMTPDPLGQIGQLVQDCERDLDRDCSRLLFAAARFERYGQDDEAQRTYREILLHFPADDATGCRKKAQGNIVPLQSEARQQ